MHLNEFYGHTVHTRFLDARSVVVDLGANNGEFARQIVDRFGCRCISVEANPALAATVTPHPRVQWFSFAVARCDGTLPFHLCRNSESSSLSGSSGIDVLGVIEVRARRLDRFLLEQKIEEISLLKCDIEGAEIEMFDSTPDDVLRRIGQITVEFHDFNGVTRAAEVHRIVRRLRALGFFPLKMTVHGHCDTLFINLHRCDISLAECYWLRHSVRNWRGLARMCRKLVPRSAPSGPLLDVPPQPPRY